MESKQKPVVLKARTIEELKKENDKQNFKADTIFKKAQKIKSKIKTLNEKYYKLISDARNKREFCFSINASMAMIREIEKDTRTTIDSMGFIQGQSAVKINNKWYMPNHNGTWQLKPT